MIRYEFILGGGRRAMAATGLAVLTLDPCVDSDLLAEVCSRKSLSILYDILTTSFSGVEY